jgi:hypothetical protein
LAHSLTPSDKGPLLQRQSVSRTEDYTTAGKRECQVKIRPSLKGLNKASVRTPVLTDPKGGGFSFAIVTKEVRNRNSSPIPGCWSALLAVSHLVVQTVSVPTFTWSMSGSIAVQLSSLHAAQVYLYLLISTQARASFSARSTRPFRVCFPTHRSATILFYVTSQ